MGIDGGVFTPDANVREEVIDDGTRPLSRADPEPFGDSRPCAENPSLRGEVVRNPNGDELHDL